jgi:hypothetical protein
MLLTVIQSTEMCYCVYCREYYSEIHVCPPPKPVTIIPFTPVTPQAPGKDFQGQRWCPTCGHNVPITMLKRSVTVEGKWIHEKCGTLLPNFQTRGGTI